MAKYIEDFKVGEKAQSPGRTITETDVVLFSGLSGDTNPAHTDAVHSAKSPFGQRIAHGALCLSVCTGLSARIGDLDGTAIAFLGIDEWRFHAPVFFGDTVTLHTTVLEARVTSKGDRGVLKRKMELVKQDGTLVQSGLFTTMVMTRAGAQAAGKAE
ncbi:MaoC/PaaZ C-terminal domain-containing protein [Futiania mangrovi]|uniref:MaoC family dehydratase N-terminal domain-containing protein n=1 Tax=Futiania mangrovi TaxID=2959716 RepID=A0A9J6P9D1_9PROT|nr:MaoC/PaaZ C-terminal domain-containing protein [Futiania mangrovii]MCP1335445.1 MaoC family dehydratase N-terminal domain-containing protein [Futiania mangrovii]